jgi:hypothetical protein
MRIRVLMGWCFGFGDVRTRNLESGDLKIGVEEECDCPSALWSWKLSYSPRSPAHHTRDRASVSPAHHTRHRASVSPGGGLRVRGAPLRCHRVVAPLLSSPTGAPRRQRERVWVHGHEGKACTRQSKGAGGHHAPKVLVSVIVRMILMMLQLTLSDPDPDPDPDPDIDELPWEGGKDGRGIGGGLSGGGG